MGTSTVQENFAYWWATQGPWVEEPNVRRSGTSGVQRVVHNGTIVYVKRQTGHLYRSPRYPFGRPTVLREGRALTKLDQLDVAAPKPIFYGIRRTNICVYSNGWRSCCRACTLATGNTAVCGPNISSSKS